MQRGSKRCVLPLMPPMHLPTTSQRGRLAIAYIIWKVVSARPQRRSTAYLSRQERARACCHISELLYGCAVKRFELLAIQDICDVSFGEALTVAEQVGAISGA